VEPERLFVMSDFFVKLIPEEPSYVLDGQTISKIKGLSWCGDNVTIIVNETIQFADAGGNFERVSCPFCKTDLLIGWWQDSMDEAYSIEDGFIDLDTVTPCCHKATSLHDLDYYFPQGFFTSMIEMEACYYQDVIQVPQERYTKEICRDLFEITGVEWRLLRVHI